MFDAATVVIYSRRVNMQMNIFYFPLVKLLSKRFDSNKPTRILT